MKDANTPRTLNVSLLDLLTRTPGVSVIAGAPGVGRTTFGMVLAQQWADRYSGGDALRSTFVITDTEAPIYAEKFRKIHPRRSGSYPAIITTPIAAPGDEAPLFVGPTGCLTILDSVEFFSRNLDIEGLARKALLQNATVVVLDQSRRGIETAEEWPNTVPQEIMQVAGVVAFLKKDSITILKHRGPTDPRVPSIRNGIYPWKNPVG